MEMDIDPPLLREACEFRLVDGMFYMHRAGKLRGVMSPAVLQENTNRALRALRDWQRGLEDKRVVALGKRANH